MFRQLVVVVGCVLVSRVRSKQAGGSVRPSVRPQWHQQHVCFVCVRDQQQQYYCTHARTHAHEVPQEDERRQARDVQRRCEGVGKVVEVLHGVHRDAAERLWVVVAVVQRVHELVAGWLVGAVGWLVG